MRTQLPWEAMYWLAMPLLAVIACVLVWRKLVREFPLFFSYAVAGCLADLARLVAYRTSVTAYYYTYWIGHVITSTFIFFAAYELFIKRVFPRFYAIDFYRRLSLVAVILTAAVVSSTAFIGKMAVLAYAIRALDLGRVLVLLFFVALMLFMGRRWNRYEFGIALGLSIDSAVFLFTFSLYLKSSGPLSGFVRDLPVIAGDLACLTWLITFLRTKPAVVPAGPVSPTVLEEAKKWEGALKESVTGKKTSQ